MNATNDGCDKSTQMQNELQLLKEARNQEFDELKSFIDSCAVTPLLDYVPL